MILMQTISPCLMPLIRQFLKPDSKFGTWCSLAAGEKREIIDTYLVLCRSKEEILLLKEDADNIIAYYESRKKVLQEEIKRQSCQESLCNRGATALLYSALSETSRLLHESIRTADLIKSALHGSHLSSLDCDSMYSYSDGSSSTDDEL